MEKEYIRHLAHQIMFDVNDEEIEEIQKELENVQKYVQILNEIDTEGVEEMIYPFEAETTYMREDVVEHVVTQKEALSNASEVRLGHVLVPKVVK